jgi:hypothetical protein
MALAARTLFEMLAGALLKKEAPVRKARSWS